MVSVEVREQNGIDPSREVQSVSRGDPDQVANPVTKHRIGEQPRPVELEKNCGMPKPCDRQAGRRPPERYVRIVGNQLPRIKAGDPDTVIVRSG